MNNMNERLREFERDSGLEIFGLGARRDMWEAAMGKYAELIVKECAGQIDVYKMMKLDSNFYSSMLRKHFGIE
jgi:hypothetical protein